MKKLKKLFNLLPAFALVFITGLGVVLDMDLTPKEAYADDTSVVFSQNFNATIENNATQYNGLPMLEVLPYSVSGVFNVVRNVTDGGITYDAYSNVTITATGSLGSVTISNYKCLWRDIDITSQDNNLGINLVQYFKYTSSTLYYPQVVFYFQSRTATDLTFPQIDNIPTFSVSIEEFNRHFYYTSLLTTKGRIVTFNFGFNDYDFGFDDGYLTGYNEGYNSGYSSGTDYGYNNGYDVGYQAGVDSQQQAITDAYNNGYSAGYNDGFSTDSTTATIFSGILQVGMLPVNVLLAIFNFEILGINLSAFISAIFTVCLTVIVIRTVTGGKNSE